MNSLHHQTCGWWASRGLPCRQNILFRSGSLAVCSRMLLALYEAVNISNEKGSSLRVFALFCTALGTLPSTDGLFINIIEGWWHRGLFNTSAWGGDRPRATDTLWMCFPSQIIWTKTISAAQIHLQLQIRHIQNDKVPKECPFQGWNCIILGKIIWSPCFSDTVRAKIKDTISLPSGINDYLGTMKFGLNNSSVSRVQVPTIPSNPNSGIPRFRQGHHLMCLSYSVVILLGSGTFGHISMILFIFKKW